MWKFQHENRFQWHHLSIEIHYESEEINQAIKSVNGKDEKKENPKNLSLPISWHNYKQDANE